MAHSGGPMSDARGSGKPGPFLLCRVGLALLAAVALIGCGSSGGDEGGSEATNVRVTASVAPAGGGVSVCGPSDASALASLQTTVIDDRLPDNSLYLRGYRVSYEPASGLAPELEGAEYALRAELPSDGLDVVLVDRGRVEALVEDDSLRVAASGVSVAYTAVYEFYGVDAYGSEFLVKASTLFEIGGDGPCMPTVAPSGVSVTGLPNPDSDGADDVRFYVSGGTPPYAVYSSDAGVVAAPGAMAGATEFVLDPHSVSGETTVGITVVDASGFSSLAWLTVMPGAEPGGLAISPASIGIWGIANPDGDASDDIVFHISGGTPPYTVYSSDGGVIAAPGLIEGGEVTVDAEGVEGTLTVTLTVVDGVGAVVEAEVTVSGEAVGGGGLWMLPGSVALHPVANPDLDVSDDVEFYIGGGAPPYRVYSSDADVVGAPGQLAEGASGFTVDMDLPAEDTLVTLTAVDALGASALAYIYASGGGGGPVGLTLSPSGVAVAGYPNPDEEASDDVMFRISGGAGPYTVYSSSAVVAEAPGALEAGVDSFVVDTGGVGERTEVAFTVVDALGEVAEAVLVVEPSSADLAVSPAEMEYACFTNPDDSPLDDLTFYVTGGAPPYLVYSSDYYLIHLAGFEVDASGVFTVDPNPDVVEPTPVTLTIVDSAGQAATARVTISLATPGD